MSLNPQIARLTANNPSIENPDLFAQECAQTLRDHRRTSTILGVVIGVLILAGFAISTKESAKSSSTLLLLSVIYLLHRHQGRERLLRLLNAQYPDAAHNAGISTFGKDSDLPPYARRK